MSSEDASDTALSTSLEDRTAPWRHRTIWELELLISGAVVFSLFQLPALFSRIYLGLEQHVSSRLFLLPFMLYYVVTLVVIALMLAFAIHFFLRGFWVALCGLNKIFPDGIRWDRYDAGPVQRRVMRDVLHEPRDLERRVDRLASSVFSVLFVVLLSLFFSLLWLVVVAAASLLLSRLVGSEGRPLLMFYVLSALALAPILVAGAIDGWFKKDPARLSGHPRLAAAVERVLRVYQRVSFGRVYNSILVAFASHSSSRRASVATFVGALALAFLFLAYFAVEVGLFGFDSYVYFPSRRGPALMDAQHYESLAAPEQRGRVPTIQSDLVTDPYLRLFVPYLPDRDRELIEERCPGVAPLRGEGLFLAVRRRGTPDEVEKLGTCLGRIYRVLLNDREVRDAEPTFYRRPSDGVVGVLLHLPTSDLPSGRNLLEVSRASDVTEVAGLDGEAASPREAEDAEEPDRNHYFIPFWR